MESRKDGKQLGEMSLGGNGRLLGTGEAALSARWRERADIPQSAALRADPRMRAPRVFMAAVRLNPGSGPGFPQAGLPTPCRVAH